MSDQADPLTPAARLLTQRLGIPPLLRLLNAYEIELLRQSKRELAALAAAQKWDVQIASDLKAGKLDHLIANAQAEMVTGVARVI